MYFTGQSTGRGIKSVADCEVKCVLYVELYDEDPVMLDLRLKGTKKKNQPKKGYGPLTPSITNSTDLLMWKMGLCGTKHSPK